MARDPQVDAGQRGCQRSRRSHGSFLEVVQIGHGNIRQREMLGDGSRRLMPGSSSLPSLGPLPPPYPNTHSPPLLEGDSHRLHRSRSWATGLRPGRGSLNPRSIQSIPQSGRGQGLCWAAGLGSASCPCPARGAGTDIPTSQNNRLTCFASIP